MARTEDLLLIVGDARRAADTILARVGIVPVSKAMNLDSPGGFDLAVARFAAQLGRRASSSDLAAVRAAVKQHWIIPARAKEGHTEGSVTFRFEILEDGRLGSIETLLASGESCLEEAGRAALVAAAPYPIPPPGLASPGDPVKAKWTFQYNQTQRETKRWKKKLKAAARAEAMADALSRPAESR